MHKASQKMAFDVIVCGSLHLDIVVDGPHLPRLDETVPGTSWKKICGGKGGNQAVMAAKAGARVAMIGRVGDDDFGQTLRANLMANSINADHVSIDADYGTGMSVAIVESTGEYGAVIVSGSNLALTPEIAAESWQRLGSAKVLILQNEIPESVNIAVAHAAKTSGGRVVLNAAPARMISKELLDLVNVLVVNRVEAEMLSGMVVSDKNSALKALPNLARAGQTVITTLGGLGLVFQTKTGASHFIEPHKITVKSTHGAGDCFIGVLAGALANGADIPAACAKANQSAAKFVSGELF
jgi:ribokinase